MFRARLGFDSGIVSVRKQYDRVNEKFNQYKFDIRKLDNNYAIGNYNRDSERVSNVTESDYSTDRESILSESESN